MSPFFQGSGQNGMGGDYGNNKMTTTNNLAKVIADNHWSEGNRDANALWPRLSTYSISNNNQTNTWFMRNGAFLRLKQVETSGNRIYITEKIIIQVRCQQLQVLFVGNQSVLCI